MDRTDKISARGRHFSSGGSGLLMVNSWEGLWGRHWLHRGGWMRDREPAS